MRQDVPKIRAALKAIAKKQPAGRIDHAIYATYLCCLRSQERGRLHMKLWNKYHPKANPLDNIDHLVRISNPRGAGSVEFKTLDDQAKWISYLRAYIEYMQNAPFYYRDDWRKLQLDFTLPEEAPAEISVAQSVQSL